MKTSELTGKALNWAVNKADGLDGWLAPVNYCGQWEHGGPIIERERLCVYDLGGDEWGCDNNLSPRSTGPTPLIAAMRCYVASRLGDNVDVPEVLP